MTLIGPGVTLIGPARQERWHVTGFLDSSPALFYTGT